MSMTSLVARALEITNNMGSCSALRHLICPATTLPKCLVAIVINLKPTHHKN